MTKISALAAQTAAGVKPLDEFVIVDKDDGTMGGGTGTDKRITVAETANALSPNTTVYVDNYSGINGVTGDVSGALQALINTAPGTNSGTHLRLVFGDRFYLLNTGLTINDKAITLEGIEGHGTPGGFNGARFRPGTSGMTLIKIGDDVPANYHSGPIIEGIGFENPNGVTLVRGLWMIGVNHCRIENCWWRYIDKGIRMDGPYSPGGANDNAWHFFNNLRFTRVGEYGPAGGGCSAIDLGVSYGSLFNNITISVVDNNVTGANFNYGVIANDPGPGNSGATSHQFTGLFLDAGATGAVATAAAKTKMVYLKYARHCHFTNIKCEKTNTGFHFGGGHNSASWGRGNGLENASFSECDWGIVIDTDTAGGNGAGHSTNFDGGYIDRIFYESTVTNKRTTANIPKGFRIGIEGASGGMTPHPIPAQVLGTGTVDGSKILRGDGTWRNLHVGTTAPSSPATNDLWVDTT